MPNITVEILRGHSAAQRAAFVVAVTAAAQDCFNVNPKWVRIRFLEAGPDEIAVGGKFAQNVSEFKA